MPPWIQTFLDTARGWVTTFTKFVKNGRSNLFKEEPNMPDSVPSLDHVHAAASSMGLPIRSLKSCSLSVKKPARSAHCFTPVVIGSTPDSRRNRCG